MTIEKETNDRFLEESVRAEVIIHIGTMFIDGAVSSEVRDALEFDWENIFTAIGCDQPEHEDEDFIVDYFRDEVNKQGFLVRFSTPIPKNISRHGYSISWGSYMNKWIYADTYQEACNKALVWRGDYIKQAKLAAGIDA